MFGIDDLAGFEEIPADPAGVSDSDLTGWIRQMEGLEARLVLAKAAVLAEWDARQVWAADGAVSGPTWIAHRGETSRVQAGHDLRTARRLAHMPATTAALVEGRIGAAKARLLAMTRRDEVADRFDAVEADLVEWCVPLTVEQTGQLLRHWANTVRPDGPTPDDRDRCELFVSQGLDGVHFIKGRVDAEWGALLSRAIGAKARQLHDATSDDGDAPRRAASWRRAEALVELVRDATAGHGSVPARPSVIVIVDGDVLAAGAGSQAPFGSICEMDAGGRILGDTARRLACDSMLTLAVTTGGVLLDLGRTYRTATDAQRKALLVRDQGCTFPGCDRPGEWCEAHHITWWGHGGSTDLANLALLCSHHHHLVHEGGFGLTHTTNGQLSFTRPDGSVITTDRPNRLPLRYPGTQPGAPPGQRAA